MKRILLPSLAGATLLGLIACGGGSSSPTPPNTSASGAGGVLTYVNPVNSTQQFALVLDAAATPTNLVLDVVGPVSNPISGTGVSFSFQVATSQATWATAPAVVSNGTAFSSSALGAGTQLLQGWVSTGQLQGLVSLKGLANQVPLSGILAKIVLTPVAGAATGTVALTDSGMGTLMTNSGPPALPIQFAVGTLTLQ